MKIKSLYFKNNHLGWEVKPIEFQNLNLLVGLTGAGKSQIISALWELRNIAVFGRTMNDVEWNIKFYIGEKEYEWKGCFGGISLFNDNYTIEEESITSSEGERIERKTDGTLVINIPKQIEYQSTNSITPEGLLFQLYSSFDFISEIRQHFKMINIRDNTQSQANVSTDFYRLRSSKLKKDLLLKELQSNNYNIAERLLIAFSSYKNESETSTVYGDILAEIKSIFPIIEDWEIEKQVSQNNSEWNISYKIKINGNEHFIPHRNIASGMLRTFNLIADIYLSNSETVFLIDEFENSLGHNCLPHLEELILEHSFESQFILTSHHPDIINTIPKENWIVIERENGAINNRKASSLPFANTLHEPYNILTNYFDKQ